MQLQDGWVAMEEKIQLATLAGVSGLALMVPEDYFGCSTNTRLNPLGSFLDTP